MFYYIDQACPVDIINIIKDLHVICFLFRFCLCFCLYMFNMFLHICMLTFFFAFLAPKRSLIYYLREPDLSTKDMTPLKLLLVSE